MYKNNTPNFNRAIQDFRSARQKASLREIFARYTGESIELLSFEDVRKKLKAQISAIQEIKDIPIESIVGSVNRYQDFLRDFLPRQNIAAERWSNIDLANQGMIGLPPIEVYQIGEVYFVMDGNHRVSVAKQLGAVEIQAYVTKVQSRVSITPDVSPEDLILKSEYVEFLEATNIDNLRPEADLTVTVPGQYEVIEEHISVHRYFMGIDQQHEISYEETVTDWYDNIYLPIVLIIREKGLLIDFPNRTETDLYLWIAEHRAALEEELKSQIPVSSAMDDLINKFSQRTDRKISRFGAKIIKSIVPNILETGPTPGGWRQSIQLTQRNSHMFCEILVPVNGHQDGWFALEEAIIIAHLEESRIHGLYVLTDEEDMISIEMIQREFMNRCEQAGVNWEFQHRTGDITSNICEFARRNDLVVINLTYPPEPTALSRLASGIRNLIQRCPRPLFFTPQVSKRIIHPLLVFDGTPKAQEAVYIASYITGQWKLPLHVISIGEEEGLSETQYSPQNYLESQGLQADYIFIGKNNSTEVIFDYIHQLNVDLLITAGYDRNPIMEILQGSDLDNILRLVQIPVLISR
jgi:nucleotide-binding universal stress UspA family protein